MLWMLLSETSWNWPLHTASEATIPPSFQDQINTILLLTSQSLYLCSTNWAMNHQLLILLFYFINIPRPMFAQKSCSSKLNLFQKYVNVWNFYFFNFVKEWKWCIEFCFLVVKLIKLVILREYWNWIQCNRTDMSLLLVG